LNRSPAVSDAGSHVHSHAPPHSDDLGLSRMASFDSFEAFHEYNTPPATPAPTAPSVAAHDRQLATCPGHAFTPAPASPGMPDLSWLAHQGFPVSCFSSGEAYEQNVHALQQYQRTPDDLDAEAHLVQALQSASLVAVPHTFHAQTVMRFKCPNTGMCCLRWTIDAKKLRGNDRNAVSPLFELSNAVLGLTLGFKMLIYAKVSNAGTSGASFRVADGQGLIQLKCEAARHDIASIPMTFWLSAGRGRGAGAQQMPRGPVQHDFAQSGVCGLAKDHEIWDFNGSVDKKSETLVVFLSVPPLWS